MLYDQYIENVMSEGSEYYNLKEEQRIEFLEWERKVKNSYIQNFIPYDHTLNFWKGCDWISFGEIDDSVLVKALQNDIRLLLKTLGKGFSWDIKISYIDGRPLSMSAKFESKNSRTLFDKIKKFVGNFWLVTYKKYGDLKTNIYWEKLYRYTDKNRAVTTESDKNIPIDYTHKKTLKIK